MPSSFLGAPTDLTQVQCHCLPIEMSVGGQRLPFSSSHVCMQELTTSACLLPPKITVLQLPEWMCLLHSPSLRKVKQWCHGN